MASAPFALWLAFTGRVNWTIALLVALCRALEKSLVMAYLWELNDRANECVSLREGSPSDFAQAIIHLPRLNLASEVTHPNIRGAVFFPELRVFLTAFWLGLYLVDTLRTKRAGESEDKFETQVHRLSAATTAIASILSLLGVLLAPVFTGIVQHRNVTPAQASFKADINTQQIKDGNAAYKSSKGYADYCKTN